MPDPVLSFQAERVIRVAKPWITEAEESIVATAVKNCCISSGPYVKDFERRFASAHDRRFGVACNSGTTALRLALAALNIGPGDKVAMPALTMIAVANAVLDCGATPVFCDSEASGVGNIDAYRAAMICHSEKCAAIILPHLYGHPIEYGEQLFPCPIIEDCAEAPLARFACGASIGTKSTLACFSFYGNKILTTGEGGMVLSSDSALDIRLRKLRAHAFSEQEHFNHTEHAFGYRMTDMSGALGLAQLRRSKEILAARKQVADWYCEELRELKNISIPHMAAGGVWWVFPVFVCGWHELAKYRKALHDAGVETRSYFRPLHRQRHLLKFAPPNADCALSQADRWWGGGFYLPLYPEMTRDDVAYIAGVLRSV